MRRIEIILLNWLRAIDYDRDTDRKRIADRLAEMGHSMQLLSVMEDALVLVKGYFSNPISR